MMRRPLLAAALVSAALVFAPAIADAQATAPATPAAPAPAYSTATTDLGTLLDNPATRAVLDKTLPGVSTNPQVDMARGMTLKQIQQFAPDKLTDAMLANVDAELAKIPAK